MQGFTLFGADVNRNFVSNVSVFGNPLAATGLVAGPAFWAAADLAGGQFMGMTWAVVPGPSAGTGTEIDVTGNAGNGETGLAALLKTGRVRKIICSFPRQADSQVFDALYRAGKIELELVPQGNLAERLRAAGAGIGAFFTPTGYGTELAKGKETRVIDGRPQVLEYPIHGDLALIKVKADATTRAQVLQLCEVFRARAVDVAPEALTIEITGTGDKIEGLLDVLRPFGIIEMVRTGMIVMTRGAEEAEARLDTMLPARAADSGAA